MLSLINFKICDTRANDTKLVSTLSSNQNCGAATSLRCHPGQRHLCVVGFQSGDVAFWDLRKGDAPAATLSAHCGPVWSVRFHSVYPNNMFTASNDGCLIHWDTSDAQRTAEMLE